jgi:hypothetical protein
VDDVPTWRGAAATLSSREGGRGVLTFAAELLTFAAELLTFAAELLTLGAELLRYAA